MNSRAQHLEKKRNGTTLFFSTSSRTGLDEKTSHVK
jgi:hypothetical protein